MLTPLVQNILLFVLGFALLTTGAELLVRGASQLAARFNVSPVVIGLTIVAFGTSLPELLVSLFANLQPGGSEIAIGNIIGSNIANLALILGTGGLIAVIPVNTQILRRDYLLLLISSFVFIGMAWNGTTGRIEGLLLVLVLVAYVVYSYRVSLKGEETAVVEEVEVEPSKRPLLDVLYFLGGLVMLSLGAQWLVDSAQFLARAAGVSDLVIGLSVVAIGTSLPELATVVIAMLRNQADIAIGNVVGSNLFNMLFIGGVASLVRPLPVPLHMQRLDFPVMIGITGIVFLLVIRAPHHITRWKALLLLACYAIYMGWLFFVG